jgi:hypothetical protein
MMGFGLLSVVAAVFFMIRQKDVKRMFAYSSIEHMGLMTFAFGVGGPIATYAGLLHMTVHSLIKSAIFFAVGHATQKAGTQLMDDIRGLIKVSPTVAWGLMLGALAILGMPPFGVFASEFLIVTTAMREQPWATPFLLLALGVAFAAVFSRVQPMVFGETTRQALAPPAGADPGLRAPGPGPDAGPVHPALPGRLVPPGGGDAGELTAMPPARPIRLDLAALGLDLQRLARRCRSGKGGRCGAVAGCRTRRGRSGGRLVSLWGSDRGGRRHGGGASAPPMPCRKGLVGLELPLAQRARYPDLSGLSPAPPACSAPPPICSACVPKGRPTTRPWLTTACGRAPTAAARARCAAGAAWRRAAAGRLPFVRVEGDGVHEIAVGPVHAGIIEPGHFRFSVVGEKVLRLEQRLGYTHKGIERRFTELRRSTRTAWPARVRAIRRSPLPGPTAWRSNRPGGCQACPSAPRGCAR